MNSKKVLVIFTIIILIIVLIFILFFDKSESKKIKIGNNTTSQEIVNYILNISSYKTQIEVEVKSNKNENKYKLKQEYNCEKSIQEVLEPNNIAGVKIIKEGQNLKIENTNLDLVSIFENYEYISENSLDLITFINNYKEDKKSEFKEIDNKIIMYTQDSKNSKQSKVLYINKETGLPEKMQIEDNSKNTSVYILYNEVDVNS